MRKFTILTILALLLQGCATGPMGSREIASFGIFAKFIKAAVKSADNLASYGVKNVDQLVIKSEKTIIADIKKSRSLYNVADDVDLSNLKNLEDLQKQIPDSYDRVLADILTKVDSLLKFTPKARKSAIEAVSDYAALGSKMEFRAMGIEKLQYNPKFTTTMGPDIDSKLQHWYNSLAKNGIEPKKADEFLKNQIASAKAMQKKISVIKNVEEKALMRKLASDILEDSMIIERKTGHAFLGEGGCVNIDGLDVYTNFSDITYRTLKQVDEAGGKMDIEDLKKLLQKNHSRVTNRTLKEACFSIQELTGGAKCGKTFSFRLKPKHC